MVRLTVSPEVSKAVNGNGPAGTGGTLTSITVQAGKAKIELAVLKQLDTWQVRIRQLTPDLTDVGESLEQAKALRQEHDDLVAKLNAKQRDFAAVLTKSSKASSEDGSSEVSIQSLADAWKDINKQMEYRRMLLDQSVAFHSSAQQFANKLDQVESQCTSEVQTYDVDTVRRQLQQHQDLKKGVLEASMATLQEGQLLLERIRKVALCAGVQSRHATTSACHAIERLLQLLQDKWRRLEELWHRRWIQLQQCVQMAQLDQEATTVRSWFDTVGEAYISKRELGDSLDSAYSLQEECLGIESQFIEMPLTMRRLVDTAEYLVHSTLPTEGECGSVRQRLSALMRRADDFGKMFTARRKNVTQAAQFFSLAQVATVKLQEIENQLTKKDMTDRHGYLANAIVDISAVALHCGRTLMARIGKNIPAAKGVENTLASLEEKCNKLEGACTARYGKTDKPNELVMKLLDNIYKFNSWLTHVAEAVVSVGFDSGSNLLTAQDFLDLHQNIVNDLKVKLTEMKTLDRMVDELAASGTEADVAASKDAAEKLKNLNEQFAKVNSSAERRLKLANDLVAFHKRVQQLTTQMDLLELHLKLEKLDPTQVPDSSVTYKNEAFKKMNADWTDVESKGNKFVADSKESSGDEKVDLERTASSVEFLLAHLSDRKAILTDFIEHWTVHVNSGKEFKTQWQQFVKDARQTIDWIMKVENDFFPEIAGELGTNMNQVKHHQKRLDDFKTNIVKAKEEVEKHLKTAELLSLKGNTLGQRDHIVNDLLKVHTRFQARVGEYRFLLNMAEKFFGNLDQLDELIKKTEKAYASEELPKEVAAAQVALREHYESKNGLHQFINFASEEADEIVIRVRQQDSEALARDEVQRILQAAEEKRNAWDKAWQDQKTRLDQNFQACQFYFDLKQLQNLLDELQRQLDLRRGNYGSSLTSAEMISKAFQAFLSLADAVEGRMREFMGTADRMVRDKHYDSRRIRHEVDETDRRWKTFYNSIKNYESALSDSINFFKSWDECEGWLNEAGEFLLGISREAPSCASSEDVDRLIRKIETYRLEGYKQQDGRLNSMDRIITDLYGSIAGPEKLQPMLDKNQEMFNAFVKAVEELAILRNNLTKTEQILAQVGAVVEKKTPRQPRFVQPLHNAEITEGHGFTFECRLECDTAAPLIEWLKDGLPMPHGTTVFKDGLCRLTIDIANANDSATYSCKATTSAGDAETTATLKVKETQQKIVAPMVAGQLKSVDAPEGTSLTLECFLSGTPYPTVTWYKDGIAITEGPDYVITVGNNNGEPCTLRIRRLNPAVHSGVYSVKASNPGGEATSLATVTVISIQKPEFTDPLKDETVQEGKGTRLECKYIGEPAPQIQWLFNETQILPSALFKITVDVGSTSLEIREVFAEDCGKYTAVAKNLGGEARTSCHVGLLETSLTESTAARVGARRPVRPQFIQPLEDLIVQEGNRITLDCVIAGYPEPEISWLHNGSTINKSKDVDIFYDNGRCSVVIYEVYLEDAGEYVCVGKNEHGSTQTSCRLIVEPLGDLSDASASATGDVPPKFTQLLKDIEGTEGELVRFECRVIGHPTPVIKWFRGRTQIQNSPEFQILSERELQALTIPVLCKADAGNYMVKANNDAGQAKCYATLIVKPASDRHAMKMRLIESCHSVQTSIIEGCTAPVITRSFRDLHARPGEPCTMEVAIEGTPKPKVHWLFNNELVSANDYEVTSFGDVYSLHIPAVTDKDAGRFTVIADNAAGKAWCSALLVVVDASQLMGDELGSPPETPLAPEIKPVTGPMPLFSAKPAAAAPRFAEQLKNVTVDEGSSVTLECRVTGYPEPFVRWYQEGRPMIAGPATEIRKQGDRATLTLHGVTEHDSGQYTCIALNPSGENTTSATVIVNASTVAPQFIDKPRTQRVREGQSARFEARVAGHPEPEVTWYREGVPIVSSADFVISNSGDVHSLEIVEVFYEDAGKFSVQVRNNGGQVQCTFDLSVEPAVKKDPVPPPVVAPQFTKPLTNQQAHVGQRVTLECAIPPYTQPDQVNWYRNEVFIELSPEYQPSYRDGVCQLTIPCATPGHTGRYTCVIVLRGASNSTDMYLEVIPEERRQEPEAPHFDDTLRNVQLSEAGHDALFVCHLTGRPPPNIQWYHEDHLIKPSKKHEIKLTRDGVCSLRVKAATPDDAGQYTCVATNLAGHQTCFATLTVEGDGVDESSYVSQDTLRRLMSSPGRHRDGEYGGVSEHYYKPVFRKVPADLEVSEGQLARFDCIVAGRPTPDVLWFRDGTEVLEDRLHKIVINEEGISSLIIDATSARDAGLYTCIARNRGGEDRFQVRLNVLPRPTTSPPRFLSRLTNQTVTVGQAVTFEAEVNGVPVPMLSWQKDNSHIVGSDHYQIQTEGCRSTLFIPSVRLEDDAWYQCTAASVSGTATNRVRLVVQAAPRPASSTNESFHRANVNLMVSATPPPSRSSPWQQVEGLTRVETVTRTQAVAPAVVHIDASGVAAPRLLEPMRDQHLNDGAMAHFWCKIYSSVPPTCEWYHNNQPLQLSDKYRIANNPRDGDYALMVFDVRPRDAGVYKCVVSNQGGEVTCIAHLHVESMHGRLPRVEHTTVSASPAVAAAEPIVVIAPETVVSQTWTQSVQRTSSSTTSVVQAPPKPVAGDPPRVIQPLKDVTAVDGSEVILSCLATGRPHPVVSWFHNERCIDRSTDFAISFDEQAGRAELVIVDCMVDDHGQFRCVFANPSGQAETSCTLTVLPPAGADQSRLIDVDMTEEFRNATAQLQQAAPPSTGAVQTAVGTDGQAPKFVQPIQPCVVVEGETCTFVAEVSGEPAPEIAWLKEKQDLTLTDRHAISADPSTGRCSLTIRTCSAADTGVYSCRASNASGRATCTANVVVVPPNVEVTVTEKTTSIKKEKVTVIGDQETRVVENSPTFTETLLPVTEVNEGSHVRLQCRYTAEPAPNVTWRFNGVELSANQRLSLSADDSQSTLVINGVNLADTGEYVCTATNALGEAATKTFLRVRKMDGDAVPPVPSVQPSSSLPSAADLRPSPNQPILSGSAFEVASSLPSLITPVPLVEPCTIIGAQLPQQPPRFTMSLHNQIIGNGQQAFFAVQFDGSPKPNIQWYINGTPVKSGGNAVVTVDEVLGSSTLTIERSAVVNEGEYLCKADNVLGTAFTTAHLFVVDRAREGQGQSQGRLSGDSTQMMISACTRPKLTHVDIAAADKATSMSSLFSSMIQAERPETTVCRTDASRRIPVTNVFIPIAVAEKRGIDAFSHGFIDTHQKLTCLSVPTATYASSPGQIFSETVAIDTGDREKPYAGVVDGCGIIELELKKLKTSTLSVEQKALPQCYRMIAEIAQPQTFSETIAVDAGDHRPCEIELLKKKTSVMDVERKALPRGVRMEAEVLPPQNKTALVYIARSKCIEAIHREEYFLHLVDGTTSPPTFIEKLQPLTQAVDNAKVTLACRVVGRPIPETVHWLRDGRQIKVDNPDFTMTYDPTTGKASLSINEVFPEDAGLFECFAQNTCGKASTQAELLVEAYEYVADSEDSFMSLSESVSMQSITAELAAELEALPLHSQEYAQTVAEALVEETKAIERGYEDTVQMADVKWCVPDFIVPQRTELVAEFQLNSPDMTDGHEIAAECRGVDLVRPRVAGKTQAMVGAQTASFGEEVLSAAVSNPVDSAMQQVVEAPSGDKATKHIVGQTFARPETIPNMFDCEPRLEPLGVVCGEDRATEMLTSPLESALSKSHPASWTFSQVETVGLEERTFSDGRCQTPDEILEADLVHVDFNRSSVGVQHCQVGPVVEYHSESEEEDLFLEASEMPSLAPQPIEISDDRLAHVTVRRGQCAMAATLNAFTEPEVAHQLSADAISCEMPKAEECTTFLSSASKIPQLPSRAIIQQGSISTQVVDGNFEDASVSKREYGNESTVDTLNLEPARVGLAKLMLTMPKVELITVDVTADFDGKIDSAKPCEIQVTDELCCKPRQEARPLTKVRAVVELVPQDRTPSVTTGVSDDIVPSMINESIVSDELERAKTEAASRLTRARQQTEVIGGERTVDLDVSVDLENSAESMVDAQLHTQSGIVGYPIAHVVGSYTRASPEKVIESDGKELPVHEISQEILVESHVEKVTILTGRLTKAEAQIQQLSIDSVGELEVDVSHEKTSEDDIKAEMLTLSKQDRLITKVVAVVELVARERTPQRDDDDVIVPECGKETMVSADLNRVKAERVHSTKVGELMELTGPGRIGDLADEVDVQNSLSSVVFSELELGTPNVFEVDVKQLPIFEEIIGPMTTGPVRQAPIQFPVSEEFPAIDEKDVECPYEDTTELVVEDSVSLVATVIDVTCLEKASVNELVIYIEETIIEEIVIHVSKALLLQQHDASTYAVCEVVQPQMIRDLHVETMSVVPVVIDDVPLFRVNVTEVEVCLYSEETMIEEIVIEIHKLEECSEGSAQQTQAEVEDEQIEPIVTYRSESSKMNYSDIVLLPLTIEHHVEATARLRSPSPPVSAADLTSMEADVVVERANVDELTVYQQEEETFSESVMEQRIEYETRAEVELCEVKSAPVFSVPLYDMTACEVKSAPAFSVPLYNMTACEVKSAPAFSVPLYNMTACEVQSAPVFSVPLYNMTAIDGHSVTLECHVTGMPWPKITWSVDGMEIKSSTDFLISQDQTTGRCTLDIGDVLPEDEGQYSVTAVNELGSSSSSAYLTVKRDETTVTRRRASAEGDQYASGEEVYSSGEETISTWTVENKQVVEECRNVQINVSQQSQGVEAIVSDGRDSVERDQYSSDGEEAYSSGEETLSTWTVENKQVFEEFRNVEIDVSLHRKGIMSTESDQQVVAYQRPEVPVFVRRLESLDVFESTPIKLECDVKGFPQPEISWFQDGKMISEDDHIKLDYCNGRCTLSIDRVSVDDEAEYICEARNAYGTASTWAELLVEKLIEGLEHLVVEEYYEVEIEMNFKWKDGGSGRAKTPPKTQATIM